MEGKTSSATHNIFLSTVPKTYCYRMTQYDLLTGVVLFLVHS